MRKDKGRATRQRVRMRRLLLASGASSNERWGEDLVIKELV